MNSQQSPEYLFVYGTLRRDTGNEMYRLLARNAEFVGDASFKGRMFLVDDYPGAVPSRSTHDVVRGEVYRLLDPDYVLERLDEYEECDPESPSTSLYRRELAGVALDHGDHVAAWVYIYNQPVSGLPQILSGDFLNLAVASRR